MSFKPNFVWGVATSSYQIEGAARTEGRGLSVWDDFDQRHPGRVFEHQHGDVACEHYQRSAEDVALMKQLGLQAYRFSISWPRVLPEGVGAVNEKGLAFYDRLVDQLLAAGIQPWATLFHWDYPLALYKRGGWLNADSPRWFADYTRVIVDRLSDRVTHWMTLNEPQCFIGLGHRTGEHAPGDRMEMPNVLCATQNVLLAHGLATQTIRARAKAKPRIGWAPTGDIPVPLTNNAADLAAAREAYWWIKPDGVWNQAWWMEPVMKGRYPEAGLLAYGNAVPPHTDEQMRTIAQPLDFFGMNIYNGFQVKAGADGHFERLPREIGGANTHNHWRVTPPVLYWGPRYVHERYGLPIVITENGTASHDWVHLDGQVHDSSRIDYTARYLLELRRAAADGIPIDGYFHWSFMDNYEWSEGYRFRFGLVHVDFATQKRTLKDSAKWYAQVVRTNGGNLPV